MVAFQVQLPSYNFTKNLLVKHDILPANSTWTFLASSSISGACVVSDTFFFFIWIICDDASSVS